MKFFSYVLTFVLVSNLAGAQVAFGQKLSKDEKRTAKVKAKISDIGGNGKTKMQIKMLDGRQFKGKITNTGENSFSILEKNGIETSLNFADVKSAGPQGFSTGAKVAIITGIAVAAAIPLIIFGTIYCNEQGC